jgi:hypothetical protein
MGSIANAKNYIQAETTPGTAATSAMKQLSAMKFRPGWTDTATPFNGGSSKVPSSITLGDSTGAISVDGIQDFNNLGFAYASRIAKPVTTVATGGTTAKQHVFTLNPDGEDTKNTYTVIWGDADQALQALYAVFNSLGLQIQRGQLQFSTAMLSREPTAGATIPSSGVTDVPAAPISAVKYDVFCDDAWVDLGTTKLARIYEANLDLGDKYQADSPINSSIVSFDSLLEAEDQSHAFNPRVALDAVAAGLVSSFKAGAFKFWRIQCIGPVIEASVNYLHQLDFCTLITGRGEVGAAPNSPRTTLPLTTVLAKDSDGNCLEATLVNTVTAY